MLLFADDALGFLHAFIVASKTCMFCNIMYGCIIIQTTGQVFVCCSFLSTGAKLSSNTFKPLSAYANSCLPLRGEGFFDGANTMRYQTNVIKVY